MYIYTDKILRKDMTRSKESSLETNIQSYIKSKNISILYSKHEPTHPIKEACNVTKQ